MSKFIIRVRHSKGTTRLELANKSSTTVKQLKQLICAQLSDHPALPSQQLTLNGKSTDTPLVNNATLSSLELHHGDMLYLKTVTSAIICQSTTNNSRKRKLNEIVSDPTDTLPPRKRARLNTNHSHHHNHNRPATQPSLVVHTLSNTDSTPSIPRNAKLSKQKAQKQSKQKAKKRSKKKKKSQKEEFLVIKSEGDTVEDIVDNYLSETNALHTALSALKPELQTLYTKQARIEAILNEKVEINEHLEESRFTSKGKSRGKRFLIVVYSFKRKKRKEAVCCYEDDRMQEIINELLWQMVDEQEKEAAFLNNRINHKNMMDLIKRNKLTIAEMANRSPALLWSLYHSFPNQEIENVLEKFVKTALKTLRMRTREMMKRNDNE